ncbi:MAG: glutathione peroxidase [Prevotellaceae bacterium]|jgi:glutathione peroxidase|nr:glutathione peroxidase [Prevotellaceae bacterium]
MKELAIIGVMLLGTLTLSAQTSFYDFTVKDIDGNDFALSSLKGRKVMVVNVASKCGYTKQYVQLQELYEKYGPDKFVVIGFPANNFMKQEPGTNAEIKEFCSSKFHVTFPMMEKISVKGDDIHPLYQWLTKKDLNGATDSPIKWNFQKFLINENGKLVDVIPPKKKPDVKDVIEWIENR